MKKLMIINTCFNLILGIQIKEKFLQDDAVDLILGGDSPRLEIVSKNSTLKKIFQDVRYLPYKDCIFHHFDVIYPERYLKRVLEGDPPSYSDIYFWNPDKNFYNFLKYYIKCGHGCNYHLYCDAIGGYSKDQPENSEKSRFWRGIKGSIYNYIDKHYYHIYNVGHLDYDYYLFKPELFIKKSNRKMVRIPDITEKDMHVFNKVFEYKHKKIEQRYIFLDTARDRYFDEVFKVIRFVSDIVGRDNLAIKLHPRGNAAPYKALDIHVMADGTPWELYCMNGLADNTVIIAPITSAALLPYILMDRQYHVICITDLIPNSYADYQGLYSFFKIISEMSEFIHMVHSFEELKIKLGEER